MLSAPRDRPCPAVALVKADLSAIAQSATAEDPSLRRQARGRAKTAKLAKDLKEILILIVIFFYRQAAETPGTHDPPLSFFLTPAPFF
jgi:hypothetical protein